MFRSIQYKLVIIFSLLVLSVITVIGSFLLVNIISFYNSEFTVMMEQVFTDEFVESLGETADSDDGLSKISETVRSYIGPLGIDTYRFYCILDAKNASVLATSDIAKSSGLTKTDNIIIAMTGKRGNITNSRNSYMDYAVPVSGADGGARYIIYIKDTKEELQSITRSMSLIILQALLIASVITIIIGYLLSRTITTPISSLTKRAERVASGDFDTMPLSKSNDEIGRLTNTFQYMSSTLHEKIEEVNSEKTKVETILENMTDGILAFGLGGSLMHINPEAEKMLGSASEYTNFDELFGSLDADISFGDLLYIRQDTPVERQLEIGKRVIRFNFVTFYMEEKASGILVVMHDITKQEKLELARREFVANVSHELRTPLTTVKSYAETLMGMAEQEIQTKFLNVIVSETDRMTRIVKDLLVLSRLDEQQDEPEKNDKIDLKEFVGDIVDRMHLNAEKKNQTLTYTAVNDTPIIVSNRDKLEQVVINIISNAVKYTSGGGKIEVFTGRVYNDLYIKVTDNGIGIPKENLSRIFERFYRVDKARSRDTGGTGLGLAIAKQIMDSLGGRISISSVYGKGTEVIISIPA